MHFTQLDQDYQDDVLAEALYARELEWFHYDFDRGNYERMAKGLEPGSMLADLKKRIYEIEIQMRTVEAIHSALTARIVDTERHARAVDRVTAKRLTRAV